MASPQPAERRTERVERVEEESVQNAPVVFLAILLTTGEVVGGRRGDNEKHGESGNTEYGHCGL
jgi:hypothetical protein